MDVFVWKDRAQSDRLFYTLARPPISFLFNTVENLKVTTRLLASSRYPPVRGFLPLAIALVLHTELSKAVDQDILPALKGLLDDLKDDLDRFGGCGFGQVQAVLDRSCNVFFGQGHEGGFLCDGGCDPSDTRIWRNMHETLGLSQSVGVFQLEI